MKPPQPFQATNRTFSLSGTPRHVGRALWPPPSEETLQLPGFCFVLLCFHLHEFDLCLVFCEFVVGYIATDVLFRALKLETTVGLSKCASCHTSQLILVLYIYLPLALLCLTCFGLHPFRFKFRMRSVHPHRNTLPPFWLPGNNVFVIRASDVFQPDSTFGFVFAAEESAATLSQVSSPYLHDFASACLVVSVAS